MVIIKTTILLGGFQMKVEERKTLIKKGVALNAKIKAMQLELEEIKTKFRKEAKRLNKTCFTHNDQSVTIRGRQWSYIDPKELEALLKKKRKGNQFYSCINVHIEKTVKVLGNEDTKSIIQNQFDPYSVVFFNS